MANVNIKAALVGLNNEVQATPMKIGNAKGWAGTYKWVSLPVVNEITKQEEINAAIEWSVSQYGKQGGRWFEKKGNFYFRLEKDLSLFVLRWS